MNRLIEHICFLLLENDFVVVPELGGFVVNKEHACSDYSKRAICMPHCWVSFNNALTHNDGLLAQLYTRTQSMSYVKAEKAIAEDVRRLKNDISSKEKVTFGNWGCLFRNEEGIICFQSLSGNIIRPHLLGFENLSIHTLEELQIEREKIQSDKKRLSVWKTVAMISAGAAAAALLFSISVPISEQKNNNTQYAGFFSEKILQADSNKDSVPLKKKTANFVSGKDRFNHRGVDKENEVLKNDNYYLIVETFRTLSVANSELKNFQERGFNNSGIIESTKAKRIYIASFSDEQKARTHLLKFVKENKMNKDAWIYSIKPTDKIRTIAESKQ